MTTLVVGASGATGKLLVEQLLKRGEAVRIIVRSTANLSEEVLNHENLDVVKATLLDLSDERLLELTKGCTAVASCLGHTLSFKGIFGPPYRLVTDATRRLCLSIRQNQPASAVKCVLMNTAGNSNRDIPEKISFAQKCVIGLLRVLIPPHADNEKAADYLRTQIGSKDSQVEWSVVRPDTLTDENEQSKIEAHDSPTRSAIFNAGETSRLNVACFMADLITEPDLWETWKGRMPVIYNSKKPLAE